MVSNEILSLTPLMLISECATLDITWNLYCEPGVLRLRLGKY
jgi:hypothetical protein